MTPYEYLQKIREPVPHWLEKFDIGSTFNRDDFFASRIVYYPGSGTDGEPVKLFGSTHSVHCFVYVDYGISKNQIESELAHSTHSFLGYRTLARLLLSESDLNLNEWCAHITLESKATHNRCHTHTTPFGFIEILERKHQYDDNHGAHRLAILFLGADGIATYDALFCQKNNISPPFVVIVQDHGFGGNYDRFGADGLLEHIANNSNAIPQWLLVAENTDSWRNFERIPNVCGDRGGMNKSLRFLYARREK